jgi:PPOX class probable F420-dependent enzyme
VAHKRDQIKMTDEEIAEFLARERVATVSSNGRDGWPHVTALWFVMRGSDPWSWTYAKSQKVRNLERDDRVTVLVESGHQYNELRGVMIKARAQLYRDVDEVAPLGEEIFVKYQGGHEIDDAGREALRAQAAKRVSICFRVEEIVTWDHSKLGGAY